MLDSAYIFVLVRICYIYLVMHVLVCLCVNLSGAIICNKQPFVVAALSVELNALAEQGGAD